LAPRNRRRGGDDDAGTPQDGGRPDYGRDSRGHEIQHRVERAEQNLIWDLANDVWRPVRHPDFEEAQQAAWRQGRNLPDPRSGHPAHARQGRPEGAPDGRYAIPRDRHADMAADLGYEEVPGITGVERLPIFRRPGGDPEYISYDQDGHATVPRDANGRQIPYDPANPDATAPPVAWKGADDPRKLQDRYSRDGTYIPTYDDKGNVVWRQPRANR
jgi:hypothetical protein